MNLLCYFLGHEWKNCRCRRCGTPKEHEWEGCKCRSCGITKDHYWQPWQYLAPKSCRQDRLCKACGARETREEHVPGKWIEFGFNDKRSTTCDRCGNELKQSFSACSNCRGTGLCPECDGKCNDGFRTCDYCCGQGDCRWCDGRRGSWYADQVIK